VVNYCNIVCTLLLLLVRAWRHVLIKTNTCKFQINPCSLFWQVSTLVSGLNRRNSRG